MPNPMSPHFEYVLRIADGSLILGQRLAELCGHGPVLEEDIALTNIALDLVGQARLLLTHAGQLEGAGRDEDRLAFLRTESAYRNVTMVELPNRDFGFVVLRNFLYGAFQACLWDALTGSNDTSLAAIAAKSSRETRYHVTHSADWVVRLGDGTDVSRERMREALAALWPYTNEFFSRDAVDAAAEADGFGVAWASLEGAWRHKVVPVLEDATLPVPPCTPFRSAGKCGRHSEHMGHLLAEMQYLQRAYPGATW